MDRDQIIARLSSTRGQRDEEANIALAEELVAANDKAAVKTLVGLLEDGTNAQKSDAIKTAYEIARRNPDLIAGHTDLFLNLLKTRNNRLLWGALMTLHHVTATAPKIIAANLNLILEAANRGSVIAKDQAMAILAILAADAAYGEQAAPIMLDRLSEAPSNQLPKYAEMADEVLPPHSRDAFAEVLRTRLKEDIISSKRKRIERVLARQG